MWLFIVKKMYKRNVFMEGASVVTFSHYKVQRIVLLYEIEDLTVLLSDLLLFIEKFSG